MATKLDISPSEEIICKGCRKPFPINCIKKHLGNKLICKEKYSDIDLSHLDKRCLDHRKRRKSKTNKKLYIQNKHIIAESNACAEKRRSKKLYNQNYYQPRKVYSSSKITCHCCARSFNNIGINFHLQKDKDCIKFYQTHRDIAHLPSMYIELAKSRRQMNLEKRKRSKDKSRQREYDKQYEKYCYELPDLVDYWHENISSILTIRHSLANNMCKIKDLREFGLSDFYIHHELKVMETKMKTKLKDLKHELDELREEIDNVTGEWIDENPKDLKILEKEARIDLDYANDMFSCFHSHAQYEMKQLKESDWIRLTEISDQIGHVTKKFYTYEEWKEMEENQAEIKR